MFQPEQEDPFGVFEAHAAPKLEPKHRVLPNRQIAKTKAGAPSQQFALSPRETSLLHELQEAAEAAEAPAVWLYG